MRPTRWMAVLALAVGCPDPATPGANDDCDGLAWYPDDDGDGAGDPSEPVTACEAPPGTVADDRDCDDRDPTVHPGAPEICDSGRDDDCNGLADDDDPGVTDRPTWYRDGDGDGFGDSADTVLVCLGSDLSTVGGDCDDRDPNRAPADLDGDGSSSCDGDCDDADPSANGRDLDLDGATTCDGDCDDLDPTANLADLDGDGTSSCGGDCNDATATLDLADADQDGLTSCDGDCDDHDPALDLADRDADGASTCAGDCDDADPAMNLVDVDLDGFTTCAGDCDDLESTLELADADHDGSTTCGGDCDDHDPSRSTTDRDQDGFDTCSAVPDCDDRDPALGPVDGDGDGASTCGGDCDDADPTRSLVDADHDGATSCDDCDDTDPELNTVDLDLDGSTSCTGDCDDLEPLLDTLDRDHDGVTTCDGDCDDRAAAFSHGCVTADLAAWRITGRNGDDALIGTGVLVDLDGDGALDLLAQTSESPGNLYQAFGVDLFVGPLDHDRDTSSAEALFYGNEQNDLAGLEVASVGDLDDDGFPDVAITVPQYDTIGGNTAVVYGGPVHPAGEIDLDTLPGWSLDGDAAWQDDTVPLPNRLGDVDGDGWTDLALSHLWHLEGGKRVGEVYIVYGDGSRPSGIQPAGGETVWTGPLARDARFGSDVAAGDFDGDGLNDVLFGADGLEVQVGNIHGGTFLAYGTPNRPATLSADVDIAAFFSGGTAPYSGENTVHPGVDLDGDGFDELVVTEAFASDLFEGKLVVYPGAAARWSGDHLQDDGAWFSIDGCGYGDNFAWSLGVADFTGDGWLDLAIGAPGIEDARGGVYLFHGPFTGGAFGCADADRVLMGRDSGDWFGATVLAGDLDGSGRPDLLVSAPGQGFGAWLTFLDSTL